MQHLFRWSKQRIFLSFCIFLIITLTIFLLAGFHAASRQISYLPKNIPPLMDSLPSENGRIEVKNQWFNLMVDGQGRIAVETTDGKVIISSLTYYTQYNNQQNNWGFKKVAVRLANDSTIEIKGNGILNELVDVLLISNKTFPKIDIRVKSHYNKNTVVLREALVAAFAIPVSEVYLKNRTVDTTDFEAEYWLQKEGVRFGKNAQSAFIYHTPNVSSLQLQTEKKLLFINLDFSLDHPFVKFPFQKDSGGKWIDLSESDYTTGSEHENNFTISFGTFQKAIPRLMLVPDGYKAGYIFTEHADGGKISTQRAAYFGSEDITNVNQATGGFVFYKIPVTKSVFYTGPLTDPGASIYEDGKKSSLLNFLDQLHATGIYDLCLHTPENENSNRQVLEESIKFMKQRYNSICWIDHGFYGGKINREAFVCDGLDSLSPFYAADIWEKYGTKFFWSPAVEMLQNANWVSVSENLKKLKFFKAYVTLLQHYLSPKDLKELNIYEAFKKLKTNYSYRLELNTLEYNSGNARPTPLYWQEPTRTRNFYSWATDQEKVYGDLSQKDVEKENAQLLNLVNHQGIFINHGYFVRNSKDDKVLTTINGKLVVNPNFNKILDDISRLRGKGDLYVTTIRDLLHYWILLEKVSFQYLPDGSIIVINNNNEPIKGLSMIIRAKDVLINEKAPARKRSGDDTIFWFDIQPKQQVNIIAR